MNISYANPKLLLEFYRGEKVPPLVTKYDSMCQQNSSSTSLKERRYPSNNTVISSISNEMEKELEREIQENRELRLIVKELQQKLQKFLIINRELVGKIEQLEKKAESLAEMSDKNNRELNRKIKMQVYQEVQDYLKLSIGRFTETLSSIRMSPIIENKLEQFMEEILNINKLSVRKALTSLKQPKNRNTFHNEKDQVNKTIQQLVQRHSKSKQKEKERDMARSQYTAVLQRLNRHNEGHRPGRILTRDSSTPQHNKTQYTNDKSSHKRPRIFNKTYQTEQRSKSRDYIRKLDF